MSTIKIMRRRTRVPGDGNHHIYTRGDGRFQIGYLVGDTVRWTSLKADSISAARTERDAILLAARDELAEVDAPKRRLKPVSSADADCFA